MECVGVSSQDQARLFIFRFSLQSVNASALNISLTISTIRSDSFHLKAVPDLIKTNLNKQKSLLTKKVYFDTYVHIFGQDFIGL